MTKSLKALSAHTFSARSELDQFFTGRQAAALVSPFLSQPVDSLGEVSFTFATASTLVESESTGDDVELGGKRLPDVPLLGCLSEKGLMLLAGDNYIANRPIDGIQIPSTIADEGTLNVVVGGSVSGVLDNAADVDTASVFLIAGQVYMISVRGTGATPAADVFINILNPSAVNVGHDDDGGNDLNSLFTFTAAVTGNYSIDISSANPAADVGGYTVDVRVQGADAVGNTNATSVHLDQGTIFGFRETGTGGVGGTDTDRYSVDLVAGHFYTFKMAGGSDYETGYYLPQTATNMDTYLRLRDAGGTIVAFNDDVGFPDDLSSGLGFYATVSGTYYLDATAYAGYTGGYSIEFQDVDFTTLDPLDSIDWESADNVPFVDVAGVPTAYVYFAAAGDTFGEPGVSYGWNAFEQQQFMLALEEYEHILGTNYEITTDVNQATFRVFTTTSTQFGAYFYPQDPGFGAAQGIGAFNVDSGGWNKPGASVPAYPIGQESLDRGGYSFAVILHELGHAHGQAHPHDTGGGSDIMAGVTSATGSYGIFNLNQGVYTVMSYNDSWDFHPDGPSPFTLADIDHGWSGTLGAFDIAELQIRYGVHDYNTGDNVYTLIDIAEDAFYECIWDSGGTDEIAYGGTMNAIIDLTAATLDYSPTGGGVISYLDAGPGAQLLRGGFTIANGAVIENATGGTGNDTLIGNSAANVLTASDGTDNLVGRGGDDTLHGGAGTDTAYYDGSRADYTVTAIISGGQITGFTVKDDNIVSPADSSNPIAVANEGTDTLDGVESLDFADVAFSLAGTVAVFDGGGNLVSMHTTIQAAIDAATTLDGYSIFASSGTYAEDVNVTKDLTIEGANEGVAGDDGRIAETSIRSLAISANGVTVDGVEVTGTVTYGSYLAGIYVSGDNFSLVNSVLDGPDTGPPGTSPVAILTELVTDLDVGSNLITGYSQGIYASGGATTGSVHDNLFQGDGAGSGSGTQNGLLSESTLLLIENNRFDGIDGGSFYALPQGPGDTLDLLDIFIGNQITDSGAARPIQIYPSTLTPNVLGTDEAEAFVGDWGGLAGVDLTFDGRGGSDHIYGDSGNDTFTGGGDNDLLVGGAGTDTAVLGAANVSYIDTAIGWAVLSSDGNDFLQQMEIVDAAGQRNLLVGSTGFATAQAAMNAAEDGDNVRLASGTHGGTVNYFDSGLTVIAQPGAVINASFLTATAFGISVYGGNSVDHITTGTGDDYINGGAGADVMAGGAGNDVYFVDNSSDLVGETVGNGTDVIYTLASFALAADSHVEILSAADHGLTTALVLTGNGFGNAVYGNSGNNVIDGGGGADILLGFGGDDVFFVDDAGDLIGEGAGGGYDTAYATASYALNAGAQVETLSVTDHGATTAIDLTGNEFGNNIYGNSGANVLDGGGAADLLYGFGGDDTFAFTSALGGGNSDLIVDFVSGSDTIALDDAVFSTLGLGALDPNAFVTGTAALDADDRIIYDAGTGALYYDADGNGSGGQVLFAVLYQAPVLVAGDFTVI